TGVTEGDIEELKAWLSTEGLVSEISSRLGDKDGSGKVIDLLKAKGVKIPREWKSIPQVRDVIQPFVSVTLAVKASSMPEEPAMERVVTHREVNAYIAANLPEGLRADTLAERKALLAKMVPEKVNSEDYGVDYGVSARVISIQGLYDATGLKAQIGLGSVYGEPVIYADADYADARVYLHEFYDMKHWEEERRKLLKDPEEMRAWILANMDEARAIHSRIEGSNPHIMVRTLSKDPALIYSNEEDIIIASLPRETMPRRIEMSLERELAETRKKIEEYEAKAYSIMSQIRSPEEVFSGRSLEVIKNAGELTVVGDCHGDYDAVTAHLEAAGKISPDGPGKYAFRLNRGDVIVFTGDYIDRGNKNVDMVEFVIAMKEAAGKAGARVITIEGNHDYMMKEFLERLSYMVEKGTKPGMEDLFELSMFVALELTGNPRVADDLWNTLTEFMDRYLPPKGSLKRKAYLSWYGSEGAMLNGALARAGITEFFGGLKRLAVVDNNVFAHANVPPMDGPTKITRRMGRIMNSPGAPLREVDTVISDIYENLIEDADIYAEANGKTEEEKYGMKIKYYSLAWPYMARNRLYLDLMASIERDEIYSFFRGHLGLPSDMPFRLWVGHDPEKGRVFRGGQDTPGEDVIIADSGITRRYRTGAGLGGGIMARGGISVLKADGTMLVHRLQRDENDLIQGAVVDGRYIYRGESPREVLPGQNADIIRSAENVRDLIRGEKDRILQAQLNLNRIRSGLEAEVTPARRKLYDELNGLEDVTKKFLLAETSFVPGDVVVNEIELDSFNPENIRVIEGLKGDSADIKIIGLRDGSVGRGTINVKSMAGAISLGEYKVFRSPAAPAWRPDAAGIHDMGRSAGDMPREGDIVIPAAEIPQGTQFMGEALTPGEVSRILANTSVHGDPFNGRRLTVKMLEEKGLSPAIRIVVQGVNVLFSSKAYVLEGGRIAVVAYVEESPGQYVARSYYLSNSQSMWRYLPSYTAETDPATGRDRLSWYHKGYSEHSLTLPSEIQEALGAMTRVPSNTVMIEKDEAMLVFAGTSRRAAHEYELPEDATYVHSVDRTPEKLSDGFFADWQRSKRLVDPEKLDFSGSPQRPDYENGFLASFKMATDFYGEVTVEVYRSVDGKYKYMLCSIGEGDSRRAWFGGVELSGEISGLGLHGKWVNTGNLTTPLYEYYAVSEGYGTERHSSDRHYVSMWEKYLSRAPAIQEYLAHLAALEPDDFPTPPTEIPASEEKMSYQRM
ncbi:MAG: metallophosphoesterase, partial [Candidatus Omnitrophica bacterium]|nr:metallophosphoesterase [Candidatus Omnitrophota bacterium]